MNEKWVWINGYENRYQVSNLGRIKSFGRNTPLIMKLKDIRGYKNVILFNGIYKKTKQVHRLVAQSFIPNPFNLPEVNHINGNKADNCVTNLEWISKSDNIKHAWKNGLKNQDGENNPNCVLTDDIVRNILLKGKYGTYTQMSKDYGISRSTLEHILKRHTWKHI